jgi:hypothetical protein
MMVWFRCLPSQMLADIEPGAPNRFERPSVGRELNGSFAAASTRSRTFNGAQLLLRTGHLFISRQRPVSGIRSRRLSAPCGLSATFTVARR